MRAIDRLRIPRVPVDVLHQSRDRRLAPGINVSGHRAPKEQREILDARSRLLKKRFEEQVQEKIVAADVEDERDGWPDVGDVGKVLIGTHADICPTPDAAPLQLGQDFEIRALVGDQVVGIEVSVRLGERGNLCREGVARLRALTERCSVSSQRCDGNEHRRRSKDRIVAAPPNPVSHGLRSDKLSTV